MTHPSLTIAGQARALINSRSAPTPAERIEATKRSASTLLGKSQPQAGGIKKRLLILKVIKKLGGTATYNQIMGSNDHLARLNRSSIKTFCQELERVGLIEPVSAGPFKEALKKITPKGVGAIPVLRQRLNDIEVIE